MNEDKSIAAIECVVAGLHDGLVAEFESPMGEPEARSEWIGEDFYKILLVTPSGSLSVVVTSVVGEEGADARVVVLDPESSPCAARTRETHRIARAVAANPAVDGVWPDGVWPKTFLVSIRPGEVDS